MFVNGPTSKRMGMLGAIMEQAGGPRSAEQMAELDVLRARMTRAALVSATLLIPATVGMAGARYL